MTTAAPPEASAEAPNEAPDEAPAGAAVEVRGSLSPSRAGDFTTCPLLYRFRTIDRLPERPSPTATRGTVVHAVLERLFDLPAAERSPAAAAALVGPEWERLLAEEPELGGLFGPDVDGAGLDGAGLDGAGLEGAGLEGAGLEGAGLEGAGLDGAGLDGAAPGGEALAEWLGSARALLERYFELEDPTRLEPAEREHYVETVLPSGLRLRGYIDRLDRAPDGSLRIVDYKSGRAPGPGFEARAMFQMRFYALVLWRTTGRVPRLLQLLYLGGEPERLWYSPDEVDLLATERKLEALWDAISRATVERDWRPSPGPACEWCSYQPICPAFGGTPPELPEAARDGAEDPEPLRTTDSGIAGG